MKSPRLLPVVHRSRVRSAAAVAISAAFLTLATFAPAQVQAKRAYDFTRSVGIRLDLDHPNYINNWATVKSSLNSLKIKNVRTDGTNMGTSADKRDKINELKVAPYSISVDFVFGNALQPIPTMQASVDACVASGAVMGFEGPNEWSKHYYNDLNDAWAQEVKDFQVAFKTYVRANGWPTGPLLCPTTWRRDQWARQELTAIGVDNYCSVGNLHYYHNNSLTPTRSRAANRSAPYTLNTFEDTMDNIIADQQGSKSSIWVTETGEPVSAGGDDGGSGVTAIVAAKYVPRLLTEFYRRNVQKIFLFELMDSAANGSYGFLQADGATRPVYDSVKNLMTILDNPTGSSFSPHSLNFSLNGAAGISSLLLEKANGHYYLLLWKDVLSTDTDQTQLVSLSWDFTAPSVKTYLPLNGSAAVNTWTNRTQIQANVRDHVLIVEIARPGT